MKLKTRYLLLAFGLLNFTVAGISDAAAYLDPGTGSILFQSVIAVVASALAVLATARQAVAQFFNRLFRRNAGQDLARPGAGKSQRLEL